MKLRRTLSGILFGVGCAMAFVGLLALLLPAVANDQLQLVLASFSVSSPHPVVGAVNACMTFALENGWQVLLGGTVMLTIGVTLFSRFTPEEEIQPRDLYRRPAAIPSEQLWEQPEPVRTGPNPFAQTALWEQFAPSIQSVPPRETTKVGFGSPMLEPNRIEEEDMPAPVQAYTRPAPPPPAAEPAAESEPVITLVSEGVQELSEMAELPVEGEQEQTANPPQSGKPTQISPRIRSTVGKRREW